MMHPGSWAYAGLCAGTGMWKHLLFCGSNETHPPSRCTLCLWQVLGLPHPSISLQK